MSKSKKQDLKRSSKEEQEKFIKSFDTVFFDCDGVLWVLLGSAFPNCGAVLKKLQEMGKKIYFVTNNTLQPYTYFEEKFKKIDFNLTEEMLITPIVAMIHYLKSINFNKKIFVPASTNVRKVLREAGFNVVEPYKGAVEFVKEDMEKHLVRDQDIGLVVLDLDLNLSIYTVLNCTILLKNPEVLYVIGAHEKFFPFGTEMPTAPGIGYIQDMVNDCTKRSPMVFGKPGKYLGDVLKQRCNIDDPGRALFIGDMLISDISFASLCGFQKMLVLSGMTSWEEFQACEIEEHIPDYYLDGIGDLLPMLNNVGK